MTIKLKDLAVVQITAYLKSNGNAHPTQKDIQDETNDIIATKMSDYTHLLQESEHTYFVAKDVSIVDPLYDETGRYPLPNPIEYWINMGVNRDVAIESVQNAQINAR